jgi:hypothetical protein
MEKVAGIADGGNLLCKGRFVTAFVLPTRLHRLGYLAGWSEKESRMMRSLTLILKTLGYSLNVFADSSWNLNAC